MNTADSQYYTVEAKVMKRSISTTMFSYIPGKTGRDSKTHKDLSKNIGKLSMSPKTTGRRALQMALCETTWRGNQTRAVFF